MMRRGMEKNLSRRQATLGIYDEKVLKKEMSSIKLHRCFVGGLKGGKSRFSSEKPRIYTSQ